MMRQKGALFFVRGAIAVAIMSLSVLARSADPDAPVRITITHGAHTPQVSPEEQASTTQEIRITVRDDAPTNDAKNKQIHGIAGGGTRATRYGVSSAGPCMGWIPDAPQHTIELSSSSHVNIRVHSTADTTLILLGEEDEDPTVLCTDDVHGDDPALTKTLPAGRYDLYIGTWNAGTRAPFSMRIRTTPVPSNSKASD